MLEDNLLMLGCMAYIRSLGARVLALQVFHYGMFLLGRRPMEEEGVVTLVGPGESMHACLHAGKQAGRVWNALRCPFNTDEKT